ncbi:filamentous hemagglutinin N-terminal domain-containing protein [Nostoc punctiforme FACHB-252]|uniref:Filamentous hemagglutinin N-terminal domain-containing protein n=1 Tax=Nostoc punctiforme FACHB-252 TaxID=1357509 RepID=A0ABR8H9X5_NOSPU|nr:filamentous hemagglutinin N-terminal domain-containing protein [Nostoc punctiforme]MBD2612218.1 filamentous hemagglutinin N-terminal domain-containing protein [Nostoc punctiforme FACHB-252]
MKKILTQLTVISWLICVVLAESVLAQSSNIVPDDTLNSESSLVEENFLGLPIELIQGGAIRGINLFHSFREFNISEGRSAYFFNPDPDIQNILARVTGTNRSEIFGLLGTLDSNYFPSKANLFLINPNGIIFGRNASLRTGGSFVATTANAVQFNNQGLFSASTPEFPQVLTINPSAFLFNQIKPAAIINQSRAANFYPPNVTGLTTDYGKSLLLLGGNVILDDGIITAFGGKVELGGLTEKGSVGLNIDGDNLDLIFPTNVTKADISLTKQALINTAGFGGGEIRLVGNNIKIAGQSEISSGSLRNQNSRDIKIQASQLDISEESYIGTLKYAGGTGGNIIIDTQNLNMSGISRIGTNTEETGGKGGDIIINTQNLNMSLNMSGVTRLPVIVTNTSSTGDGGDILINTENLNMNLAFIGTATYGGQGNAGNVSIQATNSVNLNNSTLSTSSIGLGNSTTQGAGGNMMISAKTLNLENVSGIATTSFLGQGNPGDTTLKISDYINLSNSGIFANSFSAASGGNINIETENFNIRDGSQLINSSFDPISNSFLDSLTKTNNFIDPAIQQTILSAISQIGDDLNLQNTKNLGQSNSGNINIRATNSLVMSGISSTDKNRQNIISTETLGTGKAGTLTLETGELIAGDGSVLSTKTTSSGDGGNLNIKADAVELTDNAQIVALSEGTGKAGNINLNAARNLIATNSNISTSSIQSSGGNININAENIRLFGNSDIRTNVFTGAGGGGDITLSANSIIALDDSDILSFASDGQGGDIRFNTRAFLSSPLYRPTAFTTDTATINTLNDNQQVDVNASGAVSGTITGVPDISFLQNSLTELPENAIDTNALLANSCIVRRNNQQGGSFFVTGSGGLPERPGDAPLSPYSTGTMQSISNQNNSSTRNISRSRWKIGDPIIEPQGIYRLSNDKIVLSRECS